MSILEAMLDCHDNVIYLVDGMTSITKMDDLDIYKIKMHLSTLTHDDIYRDKVIPLFTEDEEARFLLNLIFSYFEEFTLRNLVVYADFSIQYRSI